MDFKKKLKIRLAFAIGYIILGVAMIATFCIWSFKNEFLSYYGIALVTIGIAHLRRYFRITKNDEAIKKQEILETDERNVAIAVKARSLSFVAYIIATCVLAVVLYFIGKTAVANILSYTICALVLFYWVSYFIIRKKS